MYQFFVEPHQISDKTVRIEGQDVNHIKNVLRMKIGEELSVSNGVDGKEYRCGIVAMDEECITCELRFVKEDGVELPSEVYLFQGLPKADKMELIIQKAVELGVYAVVPVATKRCVVKLDDKKAKQKITRWQGIAEAAAKQSKRRIVPEVKDVMSFKEAMNFVKDFEVKLIPYELAEDMSKTKEIIGHLQPGQRVAIFIGPEGGFEEAEVEAAIQNGVEPITLGKRILRTETAGFTVLSWIMYQLEQ
ncbi:MAG: 16S rRNA (uracil(1498)-N(3))-methyltransferase [Lachnospiraceae bacterium]|nr:16S rRNA (uracil(1498)-N(3))-methyltransferase [Lachnospiraceae bacterium]MBR6666193.1 16S rRNA (uracil(1498)-N(3))-methyltransferase [Lachnospiraceae bacterium]